MGRSVSVSVSRIEANTGVIGKIKDRTVGLNRAACLGDFRQLLEAGVAYGELLAGRHRFASSGAASEARDESFLALYLNQHGRRFDT